MTQAKDIAGRYYSGDPYKRQRLEHDIEDGFRELAEKVKALEQERPHMEAMEEALRYALADLKCHVPGAVATIAKAQNALGQK